MNSFFKFLSRNRLYTVINLLGLSVSLAALIIIANFVVRNLTTDTEVEKADRIYTLAYESFIGSAHLNGERLKERFPQIEESCGVHSGIETVALVGEKEHNARIMLADASFLDMFSVKLLSGDAKTALSSADHVILTQRFAKKVFGNLDPIGQTIRLDFQGKKKERVITGVMPDNDNSVFNQTDLMLNFMAAEDFYPVAITQDLGRVDVAYTILFLLEKEGTHLLNQKEEMLEYMKTYFWPYSNGVFKELKLLPFKGLYFGKEYATNETLVKGDRFFITLFLTTGLAILLFSIFNYINLTTANAIFRAKEMATRRLLGSSRGKIMLKLILESGMLCTLAFLVGFFLAVSLEPYAANLLQSKLSVLGDLNGYYLLGYGGFIITLSLLSGIIPAFVISSFRPVEVVKGTFRKKNNLVFGKILIAFQNIIAIVMIGCSIAYLLQINRLIKAPLGYDYKNIIDIHTYRGFQNYAQMKTAVAEMKQLPFVEAISQCQGTPMTGAGVAYYFTPDERQIAIFPITADTAFLRLLNIGIVRENELPDGTGWYYNQEAMRQLGIPEESLSVTFKDKNTKAPFEIQIAGILKNYQIYNALSEPYCTMFRVIESYEALNRDSVQMTPHHIIAKISPGIDKREALETILSLVKRVSGSSDVSVQYMEDKLSEDYQAVKRSGSIILIFTFLAIIISAMGLLAMSTYYIRQRRMEIAVRKVFGSTLEEVLHLLVTNFLKITGLAFVISIPISWYCMDLLLEQYVNRIALSPLIFLGAGLISSLIALLTVFWQSSRAASENPVDSLKRG